MGPDPGVIVLGMHRSGTSAFTRALAVMGLESGPEGALMGPAPSNESGHWEVTALSDFNDRLLGECGGRWSSPPADDGTLVALAAGPTGDAARRLLTEQLRHAPWVWKDPRLCLTLPFWQAVLPSPTIAAVVLRNPLEIAASLSRRNGFSVAYSLALWERHLRSLCKNLSGVPTIVVSYDAMLDDGAVVVQQVAAFIEERVGVTVPEASRAAAARSLDQTQRHHRTEATDVAAHPLITPQQRRLFDQSLGWVGVHQHFPDVALGPESCGLELAFGEHQRMARYQDESYQLRASLDEMRDTIDHQTLFFHQELERRSAEASTLATDVMAAREEVLALQRVLDRIRRRLPVRVYLGIRRRLTARGRGAQ